MLSIQQSKQNSGSCALNALPCAIDYNGPVDASERYWNPETNHADEKSTAYFRGRKLQGRAVKLPEGYRGGILCDTNKTVASTTSKVASASCSDGFMDEEESTLETKVVEEVATFDQMVIWGHEAAPEVVDDPYSKGIQEWIAFSEAIHSSESNQDETETSGKTT